MLAKDDLADAELKNKTIITTQNRILKRKSALANYSFETHIRKKDRNLLLSRPSSAASYGSETHNVDTGEYRRKSIKENLGN